MIYEFESEEILNRMLPEFKDLTMPLEMVVLSDGRVAQLQIICTTTDFKDTFSANLI